jgi:hypothetical protein
VCFQDKFGRGLGHVTDLPAFGKDSVNNLKLLIDPDGGDVKFHEEHMNGGVDPGFPFFHKQQPLVCGKRLVPH